MRVQYSRLLPLALLCVLAIALLGTSGCLYCPRDAAEGWLYQALPLAANAGEVVGDSEMERLDDYGLAIDQVVTQRDQLSVIPFPMCATPLRETVLGGFDWALAGLKAGQRGDRTTALACFWEVDSLVSVGYDQLQQLLRDIEVNNPTDEP